MTKAKKTTKDGYHHSRKAVLQIIESIYSKQCTLLQFCKMNDTRNVLNLFDDASTELKHLLTTSIVACYRDATLKIYKANFEQSLSLPNILHHVIFRILMDGLSFNEHNVLSFGFMFEKDSYGNNIGLSSKHPNTNVSYLKSKTWLELHKRIGDMMMRHLLQELSLFIKTESNCFVQVVGAPIYDLISRRSKIKKKPKGKAVGKPTTKSAKVSDSKSKIPFATVSTCLSETEDDKIEKLPCLMEIRAHPPEPQKNLPQLVPPSVCHLGNNKNNSKKRKIDSKSVSPSKKAKRFHYKKNERKRHNDQDDCFIERNPKKQKVEVVKKKKSRKRIRKRKRKTTAKSFNIAQSKSTKTLSKILLDRNIFYSTKLTNLTAHMKTACYTGARKLIAKIFLDRKTELTSKSKKNRRLPKSLVPMVPVFTKLLKQHKSCPYWFLLNKQCPDSSRRIAHKKSRKSRKTINQIKHVPHTKVHDFLRSVCYRVVPIELWGSKHNRKVFLKHLWLYISMHKLENISLLNVMKGIRINDYNFDGKSPKRVARSNDFLSKQKLISRFYFWLLNGFLTPLLKNSFYVTESAESRQRVFYYRKTDWRRLCTEKLNELKESLFEEITREEVDTLRRNNQTLGLSNLRFVPKLKSGLTKVRPIVNMSSLNKSKSTPSINKVLKDVHRVLTYERHAFPSGIGCSSFGYDDVFQKLRKFAIQHKAMKETRPLYFVHVDVNLCFDSLKGDKLCEIIDKILSEDEYMIRRHCEVMSTDQVHYKRKFVSQAVPIDDNRKFPKFVKDVVKESNKRNAIFIDNVRYSSITKEKLMDLLKQHVTCNIVKLGNTYYKQKCGIPQGSILSPILCNYYLGDLERTYFDHMIKDEDSLLIRWVDDFLLMSYSLDYAKKFLARMLKGFPEYNCFIKAEKSLINFDATVDSSNDKIPCLEGGNKCFRWCNLLINTETLDVQTDYSRYQGEDGMRDSLSVNHVNKPGSSIFSKLQFIMTHKCHPLYFDLALNTRNTVEINIYQSCLFMVERFRVHVAMLPTGNVDNNPTFFMRGLQRLAKFCFIKISRITAGAIPFGLMFGIFVEATLSVLRRKPARFSKLLQMMKKQKIELPVDIQQRVCEISSVAVVSEFLKFR